VLAGSDVFSVQTLLSWLWFLQRRKINDVLGVYGMMGKGWMERDALPGIPTCIAVVVSWQYNCLLSDFSALPFFSHAGKIGI
jgi:hypothetical protein